MRHYFVKFNDKIVFFFLYVANSFINARIETRSLDDGFRIACFFSFFTEKRSCDSLNIRVLNYILIAN